MTYEWRLKFVGLTTLETRRERADLLEVCKILNELEGMNEKVFLSVSTEKVEDMHLNCLKNESD